MGELNILNVAGGDNAILIGDDPQDKIRAGRIIRDMLRRGYALLVEVERDGVKAFERAVDFDEKRCRYVIADFDPMNAREHDLDEQAAELRRVQEMSEQLATEAAKVQELKDGQSKTSEADTATDTAATGEPVRKRRGRPRRTVEASGARAVAVGRSAGG